MNEYFTPISTLDGIQTFIQTVEPADWYQLATTFPPSLPLIITGILAPADATAVLMQAIAPIQYCMSPLMAPTLGFGLSLEANGTIFIPGIEAMRQLCILLPPGGAHVSFQFFKGNIGPVPTIN
jgi:hypothetical protein